MLKKIFFAKRQDRAKLVTAFELIGKELIDLQKKIALQQIVIDEIHKQMPSNSLLGNSADSNIKGLVAASDLTALENRLKIMYIELMKSDRNV